MLDLHQLETFITFQQQIPVRAALRKFNTSFYEETTVLVMEWNRGVCGVTDEFPAATTEGELYTQSVPFEGTAIISGLGTSPINFPDFETNQLFHLRTDLPHSWVFPEHSCCRNIFENHVVLRKMLKWHCPTPPNFFSDGKMLSFFG